VTDSAALVDLFHETMPIYELPGQSYWRAHELMAVRDAVLREAPPRPILEVGCADGLFASKVFDRIEDGIDINPRTLQRAEGSASPYERVHLMDAREMTFDDRSFGTVFANCVIEHIPDVERVLASSFRLLRDGGLFIATIPLAAMNDHLVFAAPAYARLRQRQLIHRNLHSMPEWTAMIEEAGFRDIAFHPYLLGDQCRFWDHMDAPICVGLSGRYNIGNVLRLGLRVLPDSIRRRIFSRLAASIAAKDRSLGAGEACATVLTARRR
jgi:SAM-dependent methyltransferase